MKLTKIIKYIEIIEKKYKEKERIILITAEKFDTLEICEINPCFPDQIDIKIFIPGDMIGGFAQDFNYYEFKKFLQKEIDDNFFVDIFTITIIPEIHFRKFLNEKQGFDPITYYRKSLSENDNHELQHDQRLIASMDSSKTP